MIPRKFRIIRISIKLPKPIHSSYRMTQPPADPRGVIDYGDVDFNQDADYFWFSKYQCNCYLMWFSDNQQLIPSFLMLGSYKNIWRLM